MSAMAMWRRQSRSPTAYDARAVPGDHLPVRKSINEPPRIIHDAIVLTSRAGRSIDVSLTGRTFNWNAYACNYSGADVYLGLAPGLEDVAIDQSFGPQALVAYPGRCIPITTRKGSAGEVPLRLYALRDSAAFDVTHLGPSDVDGSHP